MVKQRTEEWLALRREGISSTDIPAILGISPWASEGDIAREKLGIAVERERDAVALRKMRIGLALEDTIRTEEEVEHGYPLRHVDDLIVHPVLPWALTSLDYERLDERCIVEAKTSMSRDWDEGLPQYVEAQVRWQMGVAGYPKAHVAALRYGSELHCFDLEHDEEQFAGLLAVAQDFRVRLAAGGPFAETRASVGRAHPADDGTTLNAAEEDEAKLRELLEVRRDIAILERREQSLTLDIQMRMADAAYLRGDGWQVSWKRVNGATTTDWKAVAADLGAGQDVIDRHTITKAGYRRFVVKEETR